MSLVPLLFSDWWQDLDEPHTVFDQHFGLPLNPEDIMDRLSPSRSHLMLYKPSRLNRTTSRYHPFLHALMKKGGHGKSTVSADKDKFKVTLDVQQFLPEEIKVKVVDNHVIVEAKHEEKEDEHGWISRQFTRKYLVPNQCNIDQLETKLSSDGVLTVTAPKKEPEKLDSKEKVIQIQFTGKPAIEDAQSTPAESSSKKEQEANQQQPALRGRKSTVKAA